MPGRRATDQRPRLTGGSARGRVLPNEVPDGVRPTAARVREALFSIVGHELTGVLVLDAFGGSGLLGLEAWSRGAVVTVVERDPRTADVIRRNAASLGADLRVLGGDILAVVSTLAPFDLILADPPYAADPLPPLTSLAPLTRQLLVLEHEADSAAPAVPGLTRDRTRTYGGTALTAYAPAAP